MAVIFIIDDDKCFVKGFQIQLLSAGLESKLINSVEGFIEKWDKNKIEILLLDIRIPDPNSCDLLRYLLEINMHVPVNAIPHSTRRKPTRSQKDMVYWHI